jgi:hypothetical protein
VENILRCGPSLVAEALVVMLTRAAGGLQQWGMDTTAGRFRAWPAIDGIGGGTNDAMRRSIERVRHVLTGLADSQSLSRKPGKKGVHSAQCAGGGHFRLSTFDMWTRACI